MELNNKIKLIKVMNILSVIGMLITSIITLVIYETIGIVLLVFFNIMMFSHNYLFDLKEGFK